MVSIGLYAEYQNVIDGALASTEKKKSHSRVGRIEKDFRRFCLFLNTYVVKRAGVHYYKLNVFLDTFGVA
jgi:hypothetical protein